MPVMLPARELAQLSTPELFMGKSFDKAISFRELYKGLKKSCNNVRWKDSVISYEWNALKNTYTLRQELLDGQYEIRGYQRFTIREPKEREIVATRIRDRHFQRSLCDNALYAQITRSFIRDNCACQRGRGVDDALNRMDAHLHRYYRKHGCEGWVIKCDIRHYFAETRHDVAKAALRKRVTDDAAYEYAAQIVDSFGGDKGIGLGSQVSQLVELAVLDDFDHWVKERLRIKHYVRYMDDFILIHEDRAVLDDALRQIAAKLGEIGLVLNAKTHCHPLKQGIVFLKWHFYLTDTGKVIRKISKRSIQKEKRRLKAIAEKVKEGLAAEEDLSTSFQSWAAHAKRGNARRVINKMDGLYNGLLKEVGEYGSDRSADEQEDR